jgi:hypothetical protein
VAAEDDFGEPIEGLFVDGKTQEGPWAIMSSTSFVRHGIGLGLGRGQAYAQQGDGRWLKKAG